MGETTGSILATYPPTLQLTITKHLDLSPHDTDRVTPTLERERERERETDMTTERIDSTDGKITVFYRMTPWAWAIERSHL